MCRSRRYVILFLLHSSFIALELQRTALTGYAGELVSIEKAITDPERFKAVDKLRYRNTDPNTGVAKYQCWTCCAEGPHTSGCVIRDYHTAV